MKTGHFPLKRLIAASLLTVAVCIWLGWTLYDESRLVETLQQHFRFEELEGQVRHLDEVLTMSARMAAASGDARWEKRYREFEPQLDAALKEAIQLSPNAILARDAAQMDDANAKLVAMENRAFALVRDGDAEQARAVLFSNEYEEQKKIYADGLKRLVASIDKQMGDAVNSRRSQIRFSISEAMGALIVTLIVWLVAIRSVRHWRTALERAIHERTQAEQATRRTNDELEIRVTERTAELGKTNETLRVENAERKRAEETLRESDEKFHQLADNITDSFWIRSPDLREVHYISPAFERIWGRSLESMYADPNQWADFILPEDRERALAAFATLAGDAPSLDIEYRIVRPAGEIRWVHVRGFQIRDAANKLIRLTGIVTDITERKQADAALLSSEARTKAIVQSSLDCIVVINHEGRVLEFNPAAEKVFGYARAEVLGRELAEVIIPPSLRERHRQGMAHYLATGETRVMGKRIEITALRSDGSEFPVELAITRMGAETPPTFTGFIRDITERKRLEGQLFQSQKLETVGKLAGGIAHEFNSILTAIMGQSELLLADLPAASPMAKNATEINKAAGRAAALTRQLLAYGRKQLLQSETIDLNQVVASMEGMFHHLLGGDVDTQIVPASDLHAVKADAGQIEQVIMNMVINARDAMPNGGRLTLETTNVSFDQESVGRYPELKPGDYVMLAITDTGTGMSEEVKARAFEPFFTTKGISQGTGLGLSTCYGIIKQSGGHISVYSEPARGATFKIYLPQAEQTAKIPAQRLDSSDLPRGTETILLVEDDPALREMAATLLRRLGYKVLAAANGIEALSLKHRRDTGHVDLLFTDVVMPHMSGKELADRVQVLSAHTKILFTSAYTENAIVHQGVLNKGVALLQKPFTPSALACKLREVLDAAHISATPVRPVARNAALESSKREAVALE